MDRPRKPSAARAPAHGAPAFRLHGAGEPAARWAAPAAWAVIGAFAAAQLAMTFGPHRVGDVFTESDFYGAYALGARALEHGHIDPSRYAVVGPVHEFVLALAGFVVRDLFLAAGLVSAAAMTAMLALWFAIVRARAGAAAGLVATLLLASNAFVFRYGWAVTTDALALALEAGALALLLARAPGRARALAAGAVAGLAFLTRYNAVVLLPAGLVALLAGWTDAPAAGRRALAWRFAVGFAAPVLPWIAFSLASGAHFRFMLHHNIAYEVFARARGIPWDTYERTMEPQFPTPWSVLARDPGAVIGRIGANIGGHLLLDARLVAGWPVAAAALLAPALAWRSAALRRQAAILFAGALSFLALVPAFHSERYSLAVLPVWTALAAVALTSPRFACAVRAGGRDVWLKAALAPALVVLALGGTVAAQKRALDQLPREALAMAREARGRIAPGERVYARKPHFAWHAGATAVAFPFADSLAELAADARRDGVRWMYFSWPEAEMRPQFMWLLDTAAVVPGLVPRIVSPGRPAVLYEIAPGFGRAPAWLADPEEVAWHRARAWSAIDARDWRARLAAAVGDQRHERWEEAEPRLEQAARLAPGDPDVMLAHADNLVHVRRYDDASALYAQLEQMQPGNPRTRTGAGWAALLAGRTQEAAQLWKPLPPYTDDPGTLQRMLELFTAMRDDDAAGAVRRRMGELGLRPGAAARP